MPAVAANAAACSISSNAAAAAMQPGENCCRHWNGYVNSGMRRCGRADGGGVVGGQGWLVRNALPVNRFAFARGGVCRLGLLHYGRGCCCSGGWGIWVCLLTALLECRPLDGASLLQPNFSLGLQQLMLTGSGVNLCHTPLLRQHIYRCQ